MLKTIAPLEFRAHRVRAYSFSMPLVISTVFSTYSYSQDIAHPGSSGTMEEITVYGSSPLSGVISEESSPYSVQSFTAEDFKSGASNSIADVLNRQANGVSINHAQNNPLQPDIQIRGFSASPLLGAPQGVAVYMNGSRINEPFGDTVNWDLIAPSSIEAMSLISGANATYGLNALGASLVLRSKTGFDQQSTILDINAGSFGRQQASLSVGTDNSHWATFFNISQFTEDGWRNFSPSDAKNGYGAISYRNEFFEWDLFGFSTKSELRGNGAAPEELINLDRKAVFTHPDITENNMLMLSSRQQWRFDRESTLNLNIFYRDNDTDSFNGDGSEYENCAPPTDNFLCEDDNPTQLVQDQFGNPVTSQFDAINNISERNQESWGITLEYQRDSFWDSTPHYHTFGTDIYQGNTGFHSEVEFAQLTTNRSTTHTGLFNEESETRLDSTVNSYSFYWVDHITFSEQLELTLSLRYNHLEVNTQDQSGNTPELTAAHTYAGLNGGVGAVYQLSSNLSIFTNLHQSSRAPSPVELACSHPDAPCTLPNTFLADPPLDEVIARNFEIGFRHHFWIGNNANHNEDFYWTANAFITRIDDDIIFQSTGGVSSNQGFFSNASDTQRLGLSSTLGSQYEKLDWQLSYTWLQATYEDSYIANSPNHPLAIDDQINVNRGDFIPGLSQHNVNASVQWQIKSNWTWEIDAHYQSGLFLRGDEANIDEKIDDFMVINTLINYEVNQQFELYLSINNLFDNKYETFGLYGEPDEVIPSLGDENTRFVSPSEPRGAWLGLRYEF